MFSKKTYGWYYLFFGFYSVLNWSELFFFSLFLDFLNSTDEKRQRAVRKALSSVLYTTESDILVVLALSDPNAIRRFNPAARFWASVAVLQKKGLAHASDTCTRFCLPTNSFERYNSATFKKLNAKQYKFLLPPDVFTEYQTNGIV